MAVTGVLEKNMQITCMYNNDNRFNKIRTRPCIILKHKEDITLASVIRDWRRSFGQIRERGTSHDRPTDGSLVRRTRQKVSCDPGREN